MLRRSLLRFGAAFTAALALPSLRAQAAQTKLKFTLDFRITGQTSPFFLAQSKGYFKDEGLDVQIDVGSGSVASITRVASGAYDLGFGDISALIEFNAANPGAPYLSAVYQYYNRAPFVIVGRKDRGVTNDFRSLQGKRIAAAAVESTRRAWPMVARRLALKANHFEWVTTDFSQRDNVIVRGDVDGATYFHDSAVSLFQRIDPRELSVLSYADAGVNVYGNAVLASNRLIVEQPKVVAGFVRATNRAVIETLANPAPSIAATKQREPLIDEKAELERWRITAGYVAAADTRSHGIGDMRKLTLEQQVDEVTEVFALKNRPSADAIFNRSFLPPRPEREAKA
jgi:ABC-type nitrate/sulfonate/bicarbonate transport system substrate-binding protein